MTTSRNGQCGYDANKIGRYASAKRRLVATEHEWTKCNSSTRSPMLLWSSRGAVYRVFQHNSRICTERMRAEGMRSHNCGKGDENKALNTGTGISNMSTTYNANDNTQLCAKANGIWRINCGQRLLLQVRHPHTDEI